ncbi:hypothetical protein HK100_000522 [Physocladia obscura]|uniref:Homeobox domain-containing protein n=1 Tax=Physocladia obscura TaxID=109957 RepID=A0AAD5XF59_9FUNG|nr:hypothetical protein HK100_000522 [Physocladia obscura]
MQAQTEKSFLVVSKALPVVRSPHIPREPGRLLSSSEISLPADMPFRPATRSSFSYPSSYPLPANNMTRQSLMTPVLTPALTPSSDLLAGLYSHGTPAFLPSTMSPYPVNILQDNLNNKDSGFINHLSSIQPLNNGLMYMNDLMPVLLPSSNNSSSLRMEDLNPNMQEFKSNFQSPLQQNFLPSAAQNNSFVCQEIGQEQSQIGGFQNASNFNQLNLPEFSDLAWSNANVDERTYNGLNEPVFLLLSQSESQNVLHVNSPQVQVYSDLSSIQVSDDSVDMSHIFQPYTNQNNDLFLAVPVVDSKSAINCSNDSRTMPSLGIGNSMSTKASVASKTDKSASQSYKHNKRFRLPKEDMNKLKKMFSENPLPGSVETERISKELGVELHKIKIWFQNRRAATKRRNADLGDED